MGHVVVGVGIVVGHGVVGHNVAGHYMDDHDIDGYHMMGMMVGDGYWGVRHIEDKMDYNMEHYDVSVDT